MDRVALCLVGIYFLSSTQVNAIEFQANPSTIILGGRNTTPELTIHCIPNATRFKSISEIKIIRDHLPIATLSKDGHITELKRFQHKLTISGFINGSRGALYITLRNLRCDDATTYYCLAHDTDSIFNANSATIDITSAHNEYPPQQFIVQPAMDTPLVTGAITNLACKACSYPNPVYSWFKDGETVQENSTSNIFDIPHANLSDSGTYRCLAKNKLGAFLSQSVHVNVAFLERFQTGAVKTVKVDEGRAVVIQLPPIHSSPKPAIQWAYGNSTGVYDMLDLHVTNDEKLVLLSTTTAESGNRYRATAFSYYAKKNTSMVFKLEVSNNGDPRTNIAPEMVIAPKDTFYNIGDDDVKLECVVNARPIYYLHYEWYKVTGSTRTKLSQGQKYRFYTFFRELWIISPAKSDAAVYECEATLHLPHGPTFPSATASANIRIPERRQPTISPSLSGILEKNVDDTVQMICEATGLPVPVLTWFYNGRKIVDLSNPRYTHYGDGKLVIKSLDLTDAGVYQCMANNEAGEVSGSTWLKVHDSSAPTAETSPQTTTFTVSSGKEMLCSTVMATGLGLMLVLVAF